MDYFKSEWLSEYGIEGDMFKNLYLKKAISVRNKRETDD